MPCVSGRLCEKLSSKLARVCLIVSRTNLGKRLSMNEGGGFGGCGVAHNEAARFH